MIEDAARQFLAQFLRQHRLAILNAATDWVVNQALDLKGQRPREETYRLVDGVVGWNEALILHHDEGPLEQFIHFVTTYRASSEFHISTLLRGFGSFRAVMADLLTQSAVEPTLAFACLKLVDKAYSTAIFQMGDEYVEKLNHTIIERRQQLEQELALVAEQRQREFQEALAVINEQRELLHQVTLPIISVFQGVLVVPLMGEFAQRRADELSPRFLAAIVEQRAKIAILDITGLLTVDGSAAAALLKLAQAVRLLGAVPMLVGISAAAAMTMSRASVDASTVQTFATLADGLLFAFQQQGYEIQRSARSVSGRRSI